MDDRGNIVALKTKDSTLCQQFCLISSASKQLGYKGESDYYNIIVKILHSKTFLSPQSEISHGELGYKEMLPFVEGVVMLVRDERDKALFKENRQAIAHLSLLSVVSYLKQWEKDQFAELGKGHISVPVQAIFSNMVDEVSGIISQYKNNPKSCPKKINGPMPI